MKKNVFLMAGILLLSLLLLPGLSGCRAVSSLIATPTPTVTPTLTMTPTPTTTPTAQPIILQCNVVRVQGASEYEFNTYAARFHSLDGSNLPMVDALIVNIVGETGSATSNRNVVHGNFDDKTGTFTVEITDMRAYSGSGRTYQLDIKIYYSFEGFIIVGYQVQTPGSEGCTK